jgi:hypothetical protein
MLTKQDILGAINNTKSNRAAARYLNVSLETFRKYAKLFVDEGSGKTLYETHKNISGKGIRKIPFTIKQPVLTEMLKEGMSIESHNIEKLKKRLLREGIISEKCNRCDFKEQRVIDLKTPLLLNFKDGNKTNWTLDNIEVLCYNCYFLYVGDLFTIKQIKLIENHTEPPANSVKDKDVSFELDKYYVEAIKKINKEDMSGKDLISKI